MLYLNPEFQRKYGPVVVENDKLQVVLNPNSWGRNIFMDEGIWNVRNDFVSVILSDLLKALNIDPNSSEAKKIRQRVLTISDNQINIEFLLMQEVKAEVKTKNFLPEYLIMLDCEMTGVVPGRDKLLQVAMVRLKLEGAQYKEEGNPLVLYLKHDGQPTNDFQKKYLTHIFKRCNQSSLTGAECKPHIEKWLGDLKGKVTPCGDCVPTDIAFLYAEDCLTRPDIIDDEQVPGTFDYEFFDLNAVKQIARQKQGKKEELKLDEAIHDGLVDCRNQTLELNEFLKILLPTEVKAMTDEDGGEGGAGWASQPDRPVIKNVDNKEDHDTDKWTIQKSKPVGLKV